MRLASAVLMSGLAVAQPPDYRVVSEVRLVVLDVGVRDRAGKPVSGLGRGAFRVFDSGREKNLAAFASEDAPVTIALAVDTSASMKSKRRDVIVAANVFVRESNPGDEVMLVTFNDGVTAMPPSPPPVLAETLGAAAMDGRTALFDGLDAALRLVASGARERKALVVISDGADNASRLSRAAVLRKVHGAHVTVYAVGMLQEPGDDGDPAFLRELARLTGGDARLGVRSDELAAACRDIAREIRARYMLAFNAAEASSPQTRPIRVAVATPGLGRLRVLARPSYLVKPVTEPAP